MEVLYTIALLLLLASASHAYRLPTTIHPSHYEVHLNISESSFTATGNDFAGTVVIHFHGSTPTTQIVLHSSYDYISITNVELNNQPISEENYFTNATTDILTINYASGIQTGTQYALLIQYTGRLSDTDMSGFYKSSYVDADGVTQYLATTQFQATHARRAFPSWDEPSFKATFTILLTYPLEFNALSNTPGTTRTTTATARTVQFNTTPVMSTYLVAFIISKFTCTPGVAIDHIPYQVCSREEAASTRAWAVELGPPLKAKFDEYTGYNYSTVLEKLDQVAIPDFSAGAMENWGLITYRETALLWDPEESSNSFKQSIAGTIAHEFVHTWFGNLVTCDWWSVTFLNEGFARLFQYAILDEVLPEWELKKQFVVIVLQVILESDSYLTALPLQSDVSSPSEVNSKFGSISYHKGASVLRMVEFTMGYENFRDGLRNYLREYEFSNTIPNNLWDTLDASVDATVSDLPADLSTVLQNWVESSGYPLLTVTTSGANVIITQERFLLSGSDTTTKWYVPITFTTSTDSNKFATTTPEGWLTPTSDLTITLPQGALWIILNNQQAGYFRVNYEPALWDRIAAALTSSNFSEIPDVNRAQIVDDVFNLAKVEKILYSKVFEIVEFLRYDVSYYSWYPAFTGFNYIFRRIGEESLLGQAIVTHLQELMENLYRSVPLSTLNESDQIYTLKQVLTVGWACRLGRQDCINSVREIFRQYKENSISPNKNLRSLVYCNALRYSSDPSDWEFLWNSYLSTDVATERSNLISALGCTTDTFLLNRYLLRSINSTSGISSQDAYSVFSAVYEGNSVGIDVAFRFLLQYHQAISEYYQSMNSLVNLLNGIATRLTSQDQVTRLETFVQTADISDEFREAASQSLETARTNIAWIEQFRDDLHEYYEIEEEELEDEHDDTVDPNESTIPEYRLSNNFQPSHYQVHLRLPHETFTSTGTTFTGTAVIHFTVRSATNEIRLHSSVQNIVVLSVELNNGVIPAENYSTNSTTDILTITYDSELEAGRLYIMRIEYDGTYGSNNQGFYKSSYLDDDGVRRYLVTTQFQTTSARRAFPCFDEPEYKATFQILITYPTGLSARSNTIGSTVQNDQTNNFTTIQFRTTPIMSTYLIAFVVSDFTCTTGASIGYIPYEVCSRENEREHREFAVEVGPQLLASLNSFTGYDYANAMEKMDQFAIPDFAAGAMENWGIVTYREPYLLWDPQVSTNLLKQSVATVIAHEFAHMWFGNLVTCKWWSETFLNEGFATYFEFFTTAEVLPDWELDKQFVIRVHQPVLQTDSYLTSQSLQSPASSPTQVSNKFGSITYSKGGSVLRMVQHFLGLENFKAGIQYYLRNHQFSTAKPEDLWEALALHVDESISKLPTGLESIMENWIKTSGFPLLYVSVVAGNLVISQERYLVSGSDFSSRWYVPISYTTSVDVDKFASTAPSGWLTPGSNLRLEYPAGAEWVILNNHETAFYRVNYANNLWDGIATALASANFSGIPELNRAQIVDDLFNLVRTDRITYSRVLRTIEFLENDVSYFPWFPVYSEFNTLINRIGLHTFLGSYLRAHLLQLSTNFYNSVPISVIDDDNQLYTLTQLIAVNLACRLGNQDCAQHMRDIFAEYRHNGVTPPKNFNTLVLCNGVRHSSNREDWDFLWQQYTITTDATERSALVTGLGCTTDETLLTELLTRAIDRESGIVISDSQSIFASVYAHHSGHNVAFRFVIENHEAMYDHFQNLNAVGTIIRGIAERFTTPEELAELQSFAESGINADLQSHVQVAVATAQSNVQWVQTYQDEFYDYYDLESPTTTPAGTASTPTTTTPSTTTDDATVITSSTIMTLLLVFVISYFN